MKTVLISLLAPFFVQQVCAKTANDTIVRQQTHEEFANFARYAEDNKALPSPTKNEKRVVLFGNSITDFWITTYPETFKDRPWLIDRGISGQTSYQFLLRFRHDVVDLNPYAVVILAGTNDIAQNTGAYDEKWTIGNIRSMIDIAKANNIKVILCSCMPSAYFFWKPTMTGQMEKIRHLNNELKAYAKQNKIPYVDYFETMQSADGTKFDPRYTEDGCHPNRAGYAVMENLLMPVINKVRGK